MRPSIERISEPRECGEGPHWHAESQSLLYVDIPRQNVYKYDQRSKTETSVHLDYKNNAENRQACEVSLVVPVAGQADTYVISVGNSLALLRWDGRQSAGYTVDEFGAVDTHRPGNRFNDGKCDAHGNLWAGTMGLQSATAVEIPRGAGSLYRIDAHDGQPTRLLSDVTCSNGLAWSGDGRRFFYVDTFQHTLDVFDCDLAAGSLSNRRVLYDFKQHDGPCWPDGLTIDADDRIWVAMYFGSCISCIDTHTGQLLQHVYVPAASCTSCTWGDDHTLYVTLAWRGLSSTQRGAQPHSGCVFAVRGLGARAPAAGANVSWRVCLQHLQDRAIRRVSVP